LGEKWLSKKDDLVKR